MAIAARHHHPALSIVTDDPTKVAYELLHCGFVAAPAIAGFDKFTHHLADWEKYVAPSMVRLLPTTVHTFMLVVGVVEIAAALVVALKPRIGAHVVALWLAVVIVNLLVGGIYYDIALRDLGLMLGALAFGQLAIARDHGLLLRPAGQS